jgi:Fuc2NAc and GlcNAc transferase
MVYIVWMINLTNFMDGIDGIASVETVTVSLAGMCLCVAASCVASPVAGVLAAATLGFLIWNWPPAKIFMGDAGSGFLGGMLAVLSLQAARTSPALFWGWVILLGVFVVDATITLLRRMVRGEPVHEAHRSHAYQRAAIRYGGHRPVTLAIGAINLCWLFPLAWLVAAGQLDGLAAVLVAYAPLVALTVWLDAGGPATT